MPTYDAYPSGQPAPTSQFDSLIAKDPELQSENDEDVWEIEQNEKPEKMAEGEYLDLLCVETACVGVLCALWYELTIYARDYAIPKSVLRAMVQCTFLAELDRAISWAEFEEDPKPLTRKQYLRVLAEAKRQEEVRVQGARHPYRVPEEKWQEMLAKAKAGKPTLS